MPKLTRPQRELVRTTVAKLYLLNVRNNRDICEYLKKDLEIELSNSQVWRYQAEVVKEMRKSAAFDREEQIGKAIGQLEDLFRKCVKLKKYQTALGVRRELSELLGIKAPALFEHKGQTLEQWIIDQAEKMKAGTVADGSKSEGGSDSPSIPETHH